MGLRYRGAGGLANPGFSGPRPVKRNMRIRVDRKCALPRRDGGKFGVHWFSERVRGVCDACDEVLRCKGRDVAELGVTLEAIERDARRPSRG